MIYSSKPQPLISVPSTQNRHRVRARDWPRPPKRDPHMRLITQLIDLAGSDSSVIATSFRPWASATFVGARHSVSLKIGGADHAERVARFRDRLPEAEFSISGHIVADAIVDTAETLPVSCGRESSAGGYETVMHLSILTIEDW